MQLEVFIRMCCYIIQGVIPGTTFLCHISVVFMMTLSPILVFLLIIQSSTQNFIAISTDGKILSWLLNLNLTFEVLRIGVGSCLVLLVYENWSCFIQITLVLLLWKWMVLSLMKNRLLRNLDFLSLLMWIGLCALSLLLKLHVRKCEFWFVLYFVPQNFGLVPLRFIFLDIPPSFAWKTVVIFGLVLLIVNWQFLCLLSLTLNFLTKI